MTSPKKTVWVDVSILSTTLQVMYAFTPSGTGSFPRTFQGKSANLSVSLDEENPNFPMSCGSQSSARMQTAKYPVAATHLLV